MPGPQAFHDESQFSCEDSRPFDVVVIGGGVSGLCAAWKLRQAGVQRIRLLELEDRLGGACMAGRLGGMAFPWGAHSIHVPPADAHCVHEVLCDLGVISSYDAAGRPLISPAHQVHWPHTRLFMGDAWYVGLDPFAQGPSWEQEEWSAFGDDMFRWALYTGADGRRAFAVPLAYSTREEHVRALDTLSMAAYLQQRGWSSPRLRWLVDHVCRREYGASAAAVSAWAGIYPWACRSSDYRFTDGYPTDVLTWPQGNTFLSDGLAQRLAAEEVHLRCAVGHIEAAGRGYRVYFTDLQQGRGKRVDARAVIFATRLNTAPQVVAGLSPAQRREMETLAYSPWVVAALQLSRMPQASGASMAWNNVIYGGPSPGYVDAAHQSRASSGSTVLSCYYPLPGDPVAAQRQLRIRPYAHWAQWIIGDLSRAHPGLAESAQRLDVHRWGNAMVRPGPGVIWGSGAGLRRHPHAGVSFASCDSSGLPLFEEALYCGIRAAEEALDVLGVSYTTSLGRRKHG